VGGSSEGADPGNTPMKINEKKAKKNLAEDVRAGNLPTFMKTARLLILGVIVTVITSSTYAQRPPRPGTITPPPPPPDTVVTTSPR
jgi:hypothetical protein